MVSARMFHHQASQVSVAVLASHAIDQDIALVWAPFVVRVGGKVSNCGFDHFDLVRESGGWRVMKLTFSSRTTGCPAE